MTTPVNMVLHECDKCHQQYDTLEQAGKCEREHPDASHFSAVKVSTLTEKEYPDFPVRIYVRSDLYPMEAVYEFKKLISSFL